MYFSFPGIIPIPLCGNAVFTWHVPARGDSALIRQVRGLGKRLAFPLPREPLYYTQIKYMYHITVVTHLQGSASSAGAHVICSFREDTLWWGANTLFVGLVVLLI
jgi:hypothetical protein